jgi:hypothetical protein
MELHVFVRTSLLCLLGLKSDSCLRWSAGDVKQICRGCEGAAEMGATGPWDPLPTLPARGRD